MLSRNTRHLKSGHCYHLHLDCSMVLAVKNIGEDLEIILADKFTASRASLGH